MQVFNLKLWSALFLLLALLLTSCGTTKYQELGFGGGNGSFASKQSNNVSESHKIQSQTGNLLEVGSTSESESLTSTEQPSVLKTDIQQNEVKGRNQKTPKVEAMVSNFIQKRYPLMSKVIPKHKLANLIPGSTSTSLEDPKPEIKKPKWPNSKSSFWKWLLTILAASILIIGLSIVLAGYFHPFLHGIESIGFGFMLIGYLILLWARNIN